MRSSPSVGRWNGRFGKDFGRFDGGFGHVSRGKNFGSCFNGFARLLLRERMHHHQFASSVRFPHNCLHDFLGERSPFPLIVDNLDVI